MFLLSLIAAQAAGGVNNPGGERIPFIKLRSADWDIVIRKTAETRARIERAKARCGSVWINACAAGVDAPVRKHALQQAFLDGVKLSGRFSYCATAVLRDLPANLARDLVNPDPKAFCETFQDPDSLRGKLDENAAQGENDLVNRLMGGKNTTSGEIKMKAPPKRPGLEEEGEGEGEGTGEERPPEPTVSPSTNERPDRPISQPVRPPEPAAAPEGTSPEARPDPASPAPEAPAPTQASTAPRAPEPAEAPARTEPAGVEPAPKPDRPRPAPAPRARPAPRPEPAPEAMSAPAPVPEPAPAPEAPSPAPEPAAAPAPEPAPTPKPKPPPAPSEFELEQQEMEEMERLSDVVAEEDDDKKKRKKKKKGKDDEEDEEAPVIVGGDEDFDAYIIIDIEALPDEE